ncbi:hypothetical protein ABZ671_00585 [Micromonospora sp. NPDC006766]|uniref:vWA domain-containing protein n=1 Tax=Micromonospora sp. NPDC006766 TaxID=3154778 RepID=UPI00340EEB3F
MSKPVTNALLLVDKSGSMGPLASDVRGGFNSYVDELRADTDREYRLTVTLFDNEITPLCIAAPLGEVPQLTEANYWTRGMTALLDAVGETITGFEATTTLGEQDRVLLVVHTDGQENRSREYTREQIAGMIRQREAGGRWSFMFLGAGPDTWQQAGAMGFSRASTVALDASGTATKGSYSGLAAATRSYSRGGSAADSAVTVADAAGGYVPGTSGGPA